MTPRELLDGLIKDMLDPDVQIKGNEALGLVVAILDGIVPKDDRWVVYQGSEEKGVFATQDDAAKFAKSIAPKIESPFSVPVYIVKRR